MIAAIGSDGIRDVVWGLAETAAAAIADAQDGIREAGCEPSELRTKEVSTGDVLAVMDGDVDAARLGRR